jgi:anaerobic selenocysteine-containing dehydrogenase
MVHASQGKNDPASAHLLSEPAIIACMAIASLPQTKTDWQGLANNYELIRSKIASVFPAFAGYNEKIEKPGGFYLGNSARERKWNTKSAKANFTIAPLPDLTVANGKLKLMTIRSHDQYNTTIYGLNDRYRGIKGERKVIFANITDLKNLGLRADDRVDIIGNAGGKQRIARDFRVVAYDIPVGCAAAYFPETNVLVPLDSVADKSFTPTSKYIVVELKKASL